MTANDQVHRQVLAEIENDLAACRAQVESLEAVARYHRAKLESVPHQPLTENALPAVDAKNGVHSGNVAFVGLKQIQAAEIVLRESGRPMKTADIAAAMLQRGFPTDDTSRLKMTLFTSMSRKSEVFKKTGAGEWQVK